VIAFNVRAAMAIAVATGEDRDQMQTEADHHAALVQRAQEGAAALRRQMGG